MKKIIFGLAIAAGLLLSSCGISKEVTSNQNQNQTQVVLSKANYKVIGTVKGECSQTYFLGIGGISKKALGESAMSNMYNNADMKGGARAIINTSISYKGSLYVIVGKVNAIATGTLIEFTE